MAWRTSERLVARRALGQPQQEALPAALFDHVGADRRTAQLHAGGIWSEPRPRMWPGEPSGGYWWRNRRDCRALHGAHAALPLRWARHQLYG
jgi:hypothetical protein